MKLISCLYSTAKTQMNGYALLSFDGTTKQRGRKSSRSFKASRDQNHSYKEIFTAGVETGFDYRNNLDDELVIGDWVEVRDVEDSVWSVGKIVAREANGSPRVLVQGFERAYLWDLVRRRFLPTPVPLQQQGQQRKQPHDGDNQQQEEQEQDQEQHHRRQRARSDTCAVTPDSTAAATVRVLTFNSWVGDARRGFCSRDSERLGWISKQLRAANVDVLCLQEVLEANMQEVTL